MRRRARYRPEGQGIARTCLELSSSQNCGISHTDPRRFWSRLQSFQHELTPASSVWPKSPRSLQTSLENWLLPHVPSASTWLSHPLPPHTPWLLSPCLRPRSHSQLLLFLPWCLCTLLPAMSLLRAAGVAARSVSAAAGPSVARRTAIVATVSKASDTSAMDFAAPASFDVAATGRRAAADLRTFFMDGGTFPAMGAIARCWMRGAGGLISCHEATRLGRYLDEGWRLVSLSEACGHRGEILDVFVCCGKHSADHRTCIRVVHLVVLLLATKLCHLVAFMMVLLVHRHRASVGPGPIPLPVVVSVAVRALWGAWGTRREQD